MTEQEVNGAISNWRQAEDDKRFATEAAERAKEHMVATMHEIGLKSQDVPGLGKVTLTKYPKLTIIVDRKEFEADLKRRGLYDQFTSTKFDLDLVKAYAHNTGDDLYGQVEKDEGYKPTFTAAKQ